VTVEGKGSSRRAAVGEPREHRKLLEKVRHLSGEGRWEGVLELRKVKDHFLFTVESTGVLRPRDIFTRAIDLLAAKCDSVLQNLG